MLNHAVKAVIDHSLIFCKLVIVIDLMIEAAPLWPKAQVIHDCGGTPAGCRDGAGKKIVLRHSDAHIKVHVRMHIDAAGQHVLSGCVNNFGVRKTVADFGDNAILNQYIRLNHTGFRDHTSVFNDHFAIPAFCVVVTKTPFFKGSYIRRLP